MNWLDWKLDQKLNILLSILGENKSKNKSLFLFYISKLFPKCLKCNKMSPPEVDFINILRAKKFNAFLRMAHRFGKFWPITLGFNFVVEIKRRIFCRTPYAGVFLLGEKFGEIDHCWIFSMSVVPKLFQCSDHQIFLVLREAQNIDLYLDLRTTCAPRSRVWKTLLYVVCCLQKMREGGGGGWNIFSWSNLSRCTLRHHLVRENFIYGKKFMF